jgi:hypothetical protein
MKAFLKCFMGLTVFGIFLLTACRKEIAPTDDDSLNLKTKEVSFAEKEHRITVHAGSSIQAALNTADAGSVIQVEPAFTRKPLL